MLVDRHAHTGRIDDIAAVHRLVHCVGQQDMRQIVTGVFQHMADIALALVVEEAMRGRVAVLEVVAAIGFDHVAGLVVQFAEVIGVGLDLDPDAFLLE